MAETHTFGIVSPTASNRPSFPSAKRQQYNEEQQRSVTAKNV